MHGTINIKFINAKQAEVLAWPRCREVAASRWTIIKTFISDVLNHEHKKTF